MPKTLIFSGQGAQKVGMGLTLYESSQEAKALYDKANDILGYDFSKICFDATYDCNQKCFSRIRYAKC